MRVWSVKEDNGSHLTCARHSVSQVHKTHQKNYTRDSDVVAVAKSSAQCWPELIRIKFQRSIDQMHFSFRECLLFSFFTRSLAHRRWHEFSLTFLFFQRSKRGCSNIGDGLASEVAGAKGKNEKTERQRRQR